MYCIAHLSIANLTVNHVGIIMGWVGDMRVRRYLELGIETGRGVGLVVGKELR